MTLSPALVLERVERTLREDLDVIDAEAVLVALAAAIRSSAGIVTMHLPGVGLLRDEVLEQLSVRHRLDLAEAFRALADRLDPPDELGVPFRCPSCGDRQRVPQAELENPAFGGRYCTGRVREHPPELLVRDRIREARERA